MSQDKIRPLQSSEYNAERKFQGRVKPPCIFTQLSLLLLKFHLQSYIVLSSLDLILFFFLQPSYF